MLNSVCDTVNSRSQCDDVQDSDLMVKMADFFYPSLASREMLTSLLFQVQEISWVTGFGPQAPGVT